MATLTQAAEQRMVLHDVSWETYEALLRDHEDRSVPHFTYDRGTLEIMSPLPVHERYKRWISQVITEVTERSSIDASDLGSTTFTRPELQRGFEADTCFYIQHEAAIRGKDRIDLRIDPPPDLAVEIDITHSTIDKLGVYGPMGVPELWRYNGERLEMLALGPDGYIAVPRSVALPMLEASALTALLAEGHGLSDTGWVRHVRAWCARLEV